MSDFFHPMTEQAAGKIHQCECCYYAIEKGERYCKQTGVWDGDYFTNRFHSACWKALNDESHDFEFSPGEGEPPEGARTMQEARAALISATGGTP